MSQATGAERRARVREFAATAAVLAVGGAGGLVAAGQAWGSAAVASSFTVTEHAATGNDLAPLVSAGPLVALAAVIVLPAVRGTGRRVVGGILVVLGALMSVLAAVVAVDLAEEVRRWTASAPDHAGPVHDVSTSAVWAWVVVAAGALVIVAGSVVALRGPRWPAMGARYERADRGRERSPGVGDEPRNPAQTWDALDRGDDPTA